MMNQQEKTQSNKQMLKIYKNFLQGNHEFTMEDDEEITKDEKEEKDASKLWIADNHHKSQEEEASPSLKEDESPSSPLPDDK